MGDDGHPTTAVPQPQLFCFGMGYTACALARRLSGRGFAIAGTSRNKDGADRISARGWSGLVLDGAAPSPPVAQALQTTTHVLVSVPPDDAGDPVLRLHRRELKAAPRIAWIGYLSTIGVYGDRAGGWVDEDSPPAPVSGRSRRRLAAEEGWLELGRASGRRVEIFRLPGIYGPGRSAVDQIRSGIARRIAKPGQVFNRMHVDDIASALEAALTGIPKHQIYNLADDEPAPAEDVVAFAARLLGRTPPPLVPFSEAQLSPMAASFYAETKRVSNARMKRALGVRLAYPTYREGLAAIAALGNAGEQE